MSKISHRAKELKSMGDHDKFLKRIQKTLYYGKLPQTDRLSLPVTELASELFSEPRTGRSLDRLHYKDAAHISREACISPCSFVLAMLYLERLKACNPDYLQCVAPSQLFLVSLMVSSKFLYDSGEDGEVVMTEWAASGGISLEELIDLEKEFLKAIQWEIFVSDNLFWQKFHALEATLAKREGNTRGNFTYTEVVTLLQSFDLHALINTVAMLTAVLVTTYTAGILTIMGSMFIASHIPGHALHQPQPTVVINNNTIDNNDTIAYHDNTCDKLRSTLIDGKKSVYVVDVLQTSIILASIQGPLENDQIFIDDANNNNSNNKENVGWDWWNTPSMTWLSHASRLIETLKFFTTPTPKLTHHHFVDMSIANAKMHSLEDQLHKGTKIRLQDQLERSWHTEWKDTISDYLSLSSYERITHFFQEVKA